MRQLDPGLGTEPASGEGPKTSRGPGGGRGRGGCQNARLAAVPETSPDRADSVVDRAARTSESRDLALSVEQEIYLKDTPARPDTDQLAFRVAERVATESSAPPDPAPVPTP